MTFEKRTELAEKYNTWLEDLYKTQKIKVKNDAMCVITFLDNEGYLKEEIND
jgi:hypothetical protein